MKNINGLIVGRLFDDTFWKDYDNILLQVIRDEERLVNLPIVSGMDFGHTAPTFTIPYGIKNEIDCNNKTFSIIENALDE